MTPKAMLLAFKKAEQEGFVTNLENYAECISYKDVKICKICPAKAACNTLSYTRKYNLFINNFDKLIRPLLVKE